MEPAPTHPDDESFWGLQVPSSSIPDTSSLNDASCESENKGVHKGLKDDSPQVFPESFVVKDKEEDFHLTGKIDPRLQETIGKWKAQAALDRLSLRLNEGRRLPSNDDSSIQNFVPEETSIIFRPAFCSSSGSDEFVDLDDETPMVGSSNDVVLSYRHCPEAEEPPAAAKTVEQYISVSPTRQCDTTYSIGSSLPEDEEGEDSFLAAQSSSDGTPAYYFYTAKKSTGPLSLHDLHSRWKYACWVMILLLATLSVVLFCLNTSSTRNDQSSSSSLRASLSPSCHNELVLSQHCYLQGQHLIVSMRNCAPLPDDWLGVYPTVVSSDVDDLGEPLEWMWTCGNHYCRGPVERGILAFTNLRRINDYLLSKSNATTESLEESSMTMFRIHLVRRNPGGPYVSYASSKAFEIVPSSSEETHVCQKHK